MPSNGTSNGTSNPSQGPGRADEVQDLLDSVQKLIVPFIQAADTDAAQKSTGHGLQTEGQAPRTALVEYHPPQKLQSLFKIPLPEDGQGKEGLLDFVQDVLKYSVNTWDQGFMDKLYASTNAVGVVSELLLSVLNTNVHVYQVSPALTLIEKRTSLALAHLFGFTGPHAGGISQPGGSAANSSSIVIARNTLYPDTKTAGIGARRFVLFTSAHGHYSLEKAAQMFGFGSDSVRGVAVDAQGRMKPSALERAVLDAKAAGETPFYVNATAGTTVLGSYDPIDAIADVCDKHALWLHIDGSWGGPVIFSPQHRAKLHGSHRASSIGVTPHKMLGVPVTCSFLLARDMRNVQRSMTLPAGYLFHNPDDDDDDESPADTDAAAAAAAATGATTDREVWDLADLTPQCGRKGESLKLALSWIYYGTSGLCSRIEHGFAMSAYLATLISASENFTLVSENPPPCWQVCFYYNMQNGGDEEEAAAKNSKITEEVARALVPRGFMVDYAPGPSGKFFRVVVNGGTAPGTVDGLVRAIEEVGKGVRV